VEGDSGAVTAVGIDRVRSRGGVEYSGVGEGDLGMRVMLHGDDGVGVAGSLGTGFPSVPHTVAVYIGASDSK
jgi:hypothetical protein